jgi:hypothetical protein
MYEKNWYSSRNCSKKCNCEIRKLSKCFLRKPMQQYANLVEHFCQFYSDTLNMGHSDDFSFNWWNIRDRRLQVGYFCFNIIPSYWSLERFFFIQFYRENSRAFVFLSVLNIPATSDCSSNHSATAPAKNAYREAHRCGNKLTYLMTKFSRCEYFVEYLNNFIFYLNRIHLLYA